jgi:hypothetical protein
LTPLKKIISDNPVTVLFSAFIATLSIFAYFVTIFERPGVNRSSYPDTILEYKHIYNQAWWYIWTTMTTIGYGDWFPLTPLGRTSAVLASLCGLVLTAILISAIMNIFQPDSSEAKLIRGLDKMERRKERNELASKMLAAFFCWKKGRMSFARYSGMVANWRQFRRSNQDLKDVFDADDISGMLRDISADVKNLLSSQQDTTPNKVVLSTNSAQVDDEMMPLLEALKSLRQPPGTTAVCQQLARSLANYGVTNLEELHAMDERQATEVLEKLNWSPLQIQKVLRPK